MKIDDYEKVFEALESISAFIRSEVDGVSEDDDRFSIARDLEDKVKALVDEIDRARFWL